MTAIAPAPRPPVETMEIAGQAVVRHYGNPTAEYAAAHSGVVIVARGQEGRVRAVGRDRIDLLHRMSTNALNGLAVGEARATVLTTAIARIVDLLWVANLGDSALCLTGAGRATAVRRWLAGFIFYNDQVKFEDGSQALGQFGLYGPEASKAAEALLPDTSTLPANHLRQKDELIILRGRPLAGDGFTVIAPAEQLPGLWEQALAAGARPAGEQAYQWLRLKAGMPEAGHELTEEFIPLEANLWDAVSFSKGCYIGQEIIARMESRGKLARRLLGLRLEAPIEQGTEIRLEAGGPAAGTVTSAGILPDLGPVALAYLRTSLVSPGARVNVRGVQAQVVPLPFGQPITEIPPPTGS